MFFRNQIGLKVSKRKPERQPFVSIAEPQAQVVLVEDRIAGSNRNQLGGNFFTAQINYFGVGRSKRDDICFRVNKNSDARVIDRITKVFARL